MPARNLYFYGLDSEGIASSEFSGGGTREGGFPTYPKTGVAYSVFSGEGGNALEDSNTGAGVLIAAGAGASASETDESKTVDSERKAFGTWFFISGSDKYGSGIADSFTGGGTWNYEKYKTGAGVSAFTAGGVRSGEVPVVPTLTNGAAFRYWKRIGERQIKTAGNTLAVTTQGAPVGSMVVIYIAWDNNNASTVTGPDDTQITVADSAGNTWVRVAGAQNTSQANRSHVQIYASKITNQIAVGGTVTATHTVSSSWVAKAAAVELFAIEGIAPVVAGRSHVHTVAADPASLTLSGLADPNIPYIILHGIAAEGPVTDAYTWDADYTQIVPVGTTGSTDETNMTISGGFRIVDITADTVDVTSTTADRDYSQVLAALQTSAVYVKSGLATMDDLIVSGTRPFTEKANNPTYFTFVVEGYVDIESVETGFVASVFDASGADAIEYAETGTPVAEAAVSTAREIEVSRFGTAVATFGARNVEFLLQEDGASRYLVEDGSGVLLLETGVYDKPGLAISIFTARGHRPSIDKSGNGIMHDRVASGKHNHVWVERNVNPSSYLQPFIGQGATFAASSINAKQLNWKTGRVRAPFVALGRSGDGRSGTAISGRGASAQREASMSKSTFIQAYYWSTANLGFVGKGTDVSTQSLTGFTVRGYAAFGSNQVTYNRSGIATMDMLANGTDFSAGTAAAPFVTSGMAEKEFVETGTAESSFTVRGFAQPGGVAVVVFQGSGTWANLYANDNFAAREPVDPPIGEVGLDSGARTYRLAGATGRATNETGEPRGTGTSYPYYSWITNTLWWTYEPSHRRVIRLNVRKVPQLAQTTSAYGLASRGTELTSLVPYAHPGEHWGKVDGTGSEDISGQGTYVNYGKFPYLSTPILFQVVPGIPVQINVGKYPHDSISYRDFDYVLEIDALEPPPNDDLIAPTVLDTTIGASGAIEFDMLGSTGDPLWNWDLLDSIRYLGVHPDLLLVNPEGNRKLSGDVFWRMDPDEDVTLIISIPEAAYISGNAFPYSEIFAFEGDSWDSLVPIPIGPRDYATYEAGRWTYTQAYGVRSSNLADPIQLPMQADKTYFLVYCQYRPATYTVSETWGNSYGNLSLTEWANGTLEWEMVDPPVNDDFANRINLGTAASGSNSTASTIGASIEEEELPPSNWETEVIVSSVWYEFTPPTTGWYVFDTGLSYYYASGLKIEAFVGTTLSNLERVSEGFIWYYSATDNGPATLTLQAGVVYLIRLSDEFGRQRDYQSLTWSLSATPVESNDNFADRDPLTGDNGSVTFDLDGATVEVDEPPQYYWNITPAPSLWWGFTPPYTGTYRFRVTGSQYPMLAAYSGSSLATLVSLGKAEVENPEIAFYATAGVEYKITVAGLEGGTATLEWAPYTPNTNSTFATAHDITEELRFGSVGAFPGTEDYFNWSNLGMPIEIEAGAPYIGAIVNGSDNPETWEEGRPMWFTFTASRTGTYAFGVQSYTGSTWLGTTYGWTGAFAIYEGDTLAELTPILVDPWEDPDWWVARYIDGYEFNDQYYPEEWSALDHTWVTLEAGRTYTLLIVASNNVSLQDEAYWDPSQFGQGGVRISWTIAQRNDDYPGGTQYWEGYFERVDHYWIQTYDAETDSYVWEKVRDYSSAIGNWVAGGTLNATTEPFGSDYYPGNPSTEGTPEPYTVLGLNPPERTVWYKFSPIYNGTYEFELLPAGEAAPDPTIAIYRYKNAAWPVTGFDQLERLASSDDWTGPYPYLTVPLNVNSSYYIQIDSRDIGGSFVLRGHIVWGQPAPVNDNFADAIELVADVPVNGTTAYATVEPDEPAIYGYLFNSVWYKLTATETTAAVLIVNSTSTLDEEFSIWEGSDFESLTPVGEDGRVWAGDGFSQVLFFGVEAGKTYYVRVQEALDSGGSGGNLATHTLTLDTQSLIPPANDDFDGATTIGPGTTNGTTDGATIQPGEPDPAGTVLPAGSGTVWHKYVAPASGFIDAWVTRPDTTDIYQQYPIGVWEGASLTNSILVTSPEYPTRGPGTKPSLCRYEVREGQTYWIQVIRRPYMTWGNYTLHLNEYLEYNDWSLDTDGFTSTTGSPVVSGGLMTCTGSQAISDSLSVLPQYGTIDLGADTPKWGREVRIHFEVRIIGGQVLMREMWYGGDSWSHTTAASNDHINLTTRTLGLWRARDVDGTHVLAMSLRPNSDNGENIIELRGPSKTITGSFASLGVGGPQHDTGWISVETVLSCMNSSNYNDGTFLYGGNYPPEWRAEVFIDGKPIGPLLDSNQNITGWGGYNGKQIRYLDFGMYRHPSAGPVWDTYLRDQRYVENNEAWTYQMRRLRVTNIVPHEPFDVGFAGNAGVFEFDGFVSDVMWNENTINYAGGPRSGSYRHGFRASQYGGANTIGAAPGGKPWGAMRLNQPSGHTGNIWYGHQWSSRRVYGMSLYAASFPADQIEFAGYNTHITLPNLVGYQTATGMGTLLLDETGQLRIRPYGQKTFCVAQLQTNSWYWIEVHVDAEVMWNVKCTVYINGVLFGTYSSGKTWSDTSTIYAPTFPAQYLAQIYLCFGDYWGYAFNSTTISPTHPQRDMYLTNLVAGRGNPVAAIGPLQAKAVAAVTDVAGHHLPDQPAGPAYEMNLLDAEGDIQWKLHSWMHEYQAGPFNVVIPAGETEKSVWTYAGLPRFWEAYFRLQATTPREMTGSGPYQFTMLGQSVPVDNAIAGIEVRAPAGTAQLMKNGTPVGNSYSTSGYYGGPEDLWGTTWTPQEINALNFGVQLSVSAPLLDVKVKVYFADEGGPENIDRGGMTTGGIDLPPTGLYNLYGDSLTAEMWVTGTANSASFGWWSGGEFQLGRGGGQANPPSGTPTQRWASIYPLWLWQARGDKFPEITAGGTPGQSVTATDYRIVRNPLVYPRFAWSADNGATWTWVYPGEDVSANYIGSDVGNATETAAFFTDNCGSLDRYLCHTGQWDSGLIQERPTATPAYRYMYWHTKFVGSTSADTSIVAVNLWARFRGCSGHPKTDRNAAGQFKAFIASDEGTRRIGTFNGTAGITTLQRFTRARKTNGEAWTTAAFNNMMLNVGYHNAVLKDVEDHYSNQSKGAAIYALTWEILVPAPADPPPSPCLQLIDLSMARTVSGSGDEPGGAPAGVDLSDVKFTSGSGDEPAGNVGIDLSDTLFATGAGPPEE